MRAIGDNLITVARSKRYTAKQFRELFLWAIGDRDAPPDGCEEAAEFVAADQREMEARMEKRKAAKAERQARWKAQKDARDARDAGDARDGHLPTMPTMPTNQPSGNNASVIPDAPVRVPATPPTIDAVLAWARDAIHKPDGKPIPDEFIRDWYALMEAAEPPWTNTRGRSLVRNWRQEVIYAWRRNQQFAANSANRRGKGNQPDGVIHHEEGYENPL